MKIIEDRIKYLLKERESSIEEYSSVSPEMQMLLAMVNMRISVELKFLVEVLDAMPLIQIRVVSDKEIDEYFPVIKTQTIKEQNNTIIKRNAVKSFIKNKL